MAIFQTFIIYTSCSNRTSGILDLYQDNSTLGIKIKYPAEWHLNRLNDTIALVAPISLEAKEQGFQIKNIIPAFLFVQVQDLPHQIRYIDNYISHYINILIKNTSLIGPPKVTLTSLAGNIAHNITYTARIGSLEYHTTEILLFSGLKKYEIYIIAPESKYSNYISAIKSIIGSFQINIDTINWVTSDSVLGNDNYSNLEIRIQHPSNWQKILYDDRGILFLSPSENSSDSFQENLGIYRMSGNTMSVTKSVNHQLNIYKALYPDFQLTESKPTTYKDNPAYMLQYTYTDM